MPTQRTPENTCPWALGVNADYLAYHDNEWGVPVSDDRVLFEFLILESAQAGLSWATILAKRSGYANAFHAFDVNAAAAMSEADVSRLREDASIIRNQAKIRSAISNAQQFLKVQQTHGSFAAYLWSFVDGKPIQNAWQLQSDCPATSDLSDTFSKDLKQRGFKFVGSTTMYAYLQAVGVINDHLLGCTHHKPCKALAASIVI